MFELQKQNGESAQEKSQSPEIPAQSFSRMRLIFALGTAIIADICSFPEEVAPMLMIVMDFIWLGILVLILGARWALFLALLPEAIPGLSLFPTWTAVVLFLGAGKAIQKKI